MREQEYLEKISEMTAKIADLTSTNTGNNNNYSSTYYTMCAILILEVQFYNTYYYNSSLLNIQNDEIFLCENS